MNMLMFIYCFNLKRRQILILSNRFFIELFFFSCTGWSKECCWLLLEKNSMKKVTLAFFRKGTFCQTQKSTKEKGKIGEEIIQFLFFLNIFFYWKLRRCLFLRFFSFAYYSSSRLVYLLNFIFFPLFIKFKHGFGTQLKSIYYYFLFYFFFFSKKKMIFLPQSFFASR